MTVGAELPGIDCDDATVVGYTPDPDDRVTAHDVDTAVAAYDRRCATRGLTMTVFAGYVFQRDDDYLRVYQPPCEEAFLEIEGRDYALMLEAVEEADNGEVPGTAQAARDVAEHEARKAQQTRKVA